LPGWDNTETRIPDVLDRDAESTGNRFIRNQWSGDFGPKVEPPGGTGGAGPSALLRRPSSIGEDTLPPARLASGPAALPPKPEVILAQTLKLNTRILNMPTYEYECETCRHRFEKFQSMSAKPLKTCPQCGRPVRRLIGAGAGLLLKDEGSRATNHRRAGGSSCSLDTTGITCCGRNSRCDSPSCG
jgi:putative FmdB family regulatory protein